MLDGVVANAADLAFDYASPTSLPFDREDLGTSEEVRYHALAYLRHVMRRTSGGDRLLGQFLQVARNPHRQMAPESRWVQSAFATTVDAGGILAVASHPERMVPIDGSSRLARTGLGRTLARTTSTERSLFPDSVRGSARVESFDTHENRLVLYVLRLAADLVADFDAKPTTNVKLRDDLREMREELSWMTTFDFFHEVGAMRMVPLQSTVLQRREGYRDFLGHYLQLSLSSVLADDRDRWHALLDLKDGALLYELWTFFEVKRVLDKLLGRPVSADLIRTEAERRRVPFSAKVTYAQGNVELFYNQTYEGKEGSYSVRLRPDVVVRVRRLGRWDALILDAKLKFAGDRIDALGDAGASEWDRSVTRDDLYKMHAYRDAIREAVGAFVLFPGSKASMFAADEGAPPWTGGGCCAFGTRRDFGAAGEKRYSPNSLGTRCRRRREGVPTVGEVRRGGDLQVRPEP